MAVFAVYQFSLSLGASSGFSAVAIPHLEEGGGGGGGITMTQEQLSWYDNNHRPSKKKNPLPSQFKVSYTYFILCFPKKLNNINFFFAKSQVREPSHPDDDPDGRPRRPPRPVAGLPHGPPPRLPRLLRRVRLPGRRGGLGHAPLREVPGWGGRRAVLRADGGRHKLSFFFLDVGWGVAPSSNLVFLQWHTLIGLRDISISNIGFFLVLHGWDP